jgi:hypothetical protein
MLLMNHHIDGIRPSLTRRAFALFVGLVAIGLMSASIGHSDDKPVKAAADAKPDEAAMMAEFLKAGAPGPEHARLKEFAGDWDALVKTFQPDGTPGGTSKGVTHAKMVLGDRFLQSSYEGEMEMAPGVKMPFFGVGLNGYDKGKKKYTGLWIDTMSTTMMITEGTADANGTITSEGTVADPMTGKPMKVKDIGSRIDKDTFKYELYMSNPGEEKLVKAIEITYTRKK